jgi:hypothetical protein
VTAKTKDPSLPSYVHPVLEELMDDLQAAYDFWTGLKGVKEKHLPREVGEPAQAYKGRLMRAEWTDFYRTAIEGFAGVLSRFELRNPPASMEKVQDNIDLLGNSVQSFLLTVDQWVLRDGGAPILVEMEAELPENNAEKRDRRPYLVTHPRRFMLNWRPGMNGSKPVVQKCTFLEYRVKEESRSAGTGVGPRKATGQNPDPEALALASGGFGDEMEEVYRVCGPGWWVVMRISTDKKSATVIDRGLFLDHTKKPLTYVPVVWYPASRADFGEGDLPMDRTGRLNAAHFRKTSDYEEKDHRVNMPVPVEEGGMPPTPGQKDTRNVLGPNTLKRVQLGGKFYFAEPNATSLRETREGIMHLEEQIQQQSISFLYGSSGASKTATQSGLEAASSQASLSAMVEQKDSVFQRIMAIWCDYTGEVLHPDAGLAISNTIYDKPLTSQDVAQLPPLVDGLLMSRRSAIHELQRAGINRSSNSPEEELALIDKEQKKLAKEIEDSAPPEPDPASLADDTSIPTSTDKAKRPAKPAAKGAGNAPVKPAPKA